MTAVLLTRSRVWHGRFGPYLRQICATEGMADVDLLDLDSMDGVELRRRLADYDAVVMAHAPVWRHEAEALLEHVRHGAGLVAVRPSRTLLRMLGLSPRDFQRGHGYLRCSQRHPVVAGLPDDAIQIPVPTDRIDLSSTDPDRLADVVALAGWQEQPDPGQSIADPAVISGRCGEGRVVVIGYDLAAAVMRLRHGDPDRIGTRANGTVPYRQMDLIVDAVDPRCWHHPQADLHGQLLVGAITAVAPAPVPRWWYYPDPDTTTVIIQDSDDDWSSRAEFEQLLESAREFGFRLTIYLMLGQRETVLTPDEIETLRSEGHSFGVHHDAVASGWEDAEDQELTLPDTVRADLATYRKRYGGVPVANRNHCLVWAGWAKLAQVYAEEGLRMELNAQGTNAAWTGYLFGSARPMRHVDLDGTVINVFQQPTQIYDDLTLVDQLGKHPEAESDRVIAHINHCRNETFEPLSMQSHAVSFAGYSAAFFRTIWAYARQNGLAIWSAEQWARETDARDRSTIRSRNGAFDVVAHGEHGSRTLMLPVPATTGIELDGRPISAARRVVHGTEYALIMVDASPDGVTHEVVLRSADRSAG